MRGDDEAAFAALFERHRRELRVHCYRILGSFEEAEELLQETFLRAWRARAEFEGRASMRTWLYRIATNACLDAARRRTRPAGGAEAARADGPAYGEIPWLQPFPDELLDQVADPGEAPDARLIDRETIELGFMAATQHLPPNQRAVLILRDVAGLSAQETADALDTSVASANSALQRARETLRERLPRRRAEWSRGEQPSAEEERLLRRYVEAHERADPSVLAELLSADASFSMPPEPTWVVGREPIMRFLDEHGFGSAERLGQLRLVPLRANRQPAAANYVRRPGSSEFVAMALDVLRFEGGELVEMTAFEPHLLAAFGLPEKLPAADEFPRAPRLHG